jgi:hypothetical protein
MSEKSCLGLAVSFLIGVAVTAAVAYIYWDIRAGLRETQLLSDVHDPLRTALDDINSTIEKGDTDLAVQKITLLRSEWNSYLDGGKTPELFVHRIEALSTPVP